MGFDENLSTTSRNAVENRVITQRILQDETNYLLKTEAETKYAVEYVSTTPATIRDKIYSVNGDFYAGDSANSTLHEIGGKVKTVNSQMPDSNGDVAIEAADIPTTTTGVTVQGALDAAATKTYVQSLYPVGTIYMNDVATTHPFDFGTWQLIDAKFLYGCASDFRDIGNTGGASTVTLGTDHFPTGPLSVNFPAVTGSTGKMSGNSSGWFNLSSKAGVVPNNFATDAVDGTRFKLKSGTKSNAGAENPGRPGYAITLDLQHTHSITIPAQTLSVTINSGTQNAFDIIPPYKKVAIWHRVS